MRDGREERTVGLDEDTVDRRHGGRGAEFVGGLERDDAAEREVRAEVERPARLAGPSREAMEDGPWRRSLVDQHAERFVPRFS